MTSFGCNRLQLPGWNPNFTVQGQVCHRIGSLFPAQNMQPKFLQIYFIDNIPKEVRTRLAIANHLQPDIVRTLTELFHQSNRYVQTLKTAVEILNDLPAENLSVVIHEDKRPGNQHARRYNAPNGDEVGILMPNEPTSNRDILLHQRDGLVKHISELHRAYDPLQYPIFFPYGTDGYSIYLTTDKGKKVTQKQYYLYHIMTRPGNHLLLGKRLFQQFLVDVYCKIEGERLQYIRREQKALRADNYQNFHDTLLTADCDPRRVGQRVVLRSSFTGGPRYMHQRQQDAITYVRMYGRPDLFITTTTNPKWPEINDNLLPNQDPSSRPDIVTRVFHLKLKQLMTLFKSGIYGDLQAWLYVVEFQKRGLPHAHILIWLAPNAKIHPDNIDHIISAEIPNPSSAPVLNNLVASHMIHGPCGPFNKNSPCMRDGKCTKGFPKEFREETQLGQDAYPKYRRSNVESGGQSVTINKVANGKQIQVTIDNRWVVPYNPFLLRQMNCHTNVEMCTSVKSIKYVLKYVHKGNDQAVYSLENLEGPDEIQQFQEARYVGSTEAAYRIFGFPMHEHFPTVIQLAVHLENGQRVYFNESNALQQAMNGPPKTTLTAFFKLCQSDVFAKTLTYPELPQFYTWDNSAKKWKRRKRGNPVENFPDVFKVQCLGRVYTISPKQAECYFLRILLHQLKGPCSFDDLKNANGLHCMSYRETCLALGLITDDLHLDKAMSEASNSQSPYLLRKLFAVILTSCEPSDPTALWQKYQDSLAEDLLHEYDGNGLGNREQIFHQCLVLIHQLVMEMSGKTLEHYGLMIPVLPNQIDNVDCARYTNYSRQEQEAFVSQHEPQLTLDQQQVYNMFLSNVDNANHLLLFLDAPGGTGKTFLLNLILAKIRSSGHVALATASSGIAATLLNGGRTLHSTFKIPLDVHMKDMATCAIKKGTSLAKIILNCKAIIIDEALMTHKAAYESLDRTLQDIRENTKPFGGIPTMFCGDFRQILPIVKNGTRANVVDATLKRSYLWQHVTVAHLMTNMRALLTQNTKSLDYSNFLMSIGAGTFTVKKIPDTITISQDIVHAKSSNELINIVYGI